MELRIELSTCLRTGKCYYEFPGVFSEGSDGFPVVNPDYETRATLAEIQAAVTLCPTESIRLANVAEGGVGGAAGTSP